MAKPSPFLEPGTHTASKALAIVSLSRDNYQPISLEASAGAVDGYAEGAVLNTRFGSFPHSTLLDIPWGSQVRASTVDTGSRGRKRRREATDEGTPAPSHDEEVKADGNATLKKAVTASSGFIYLLRPTPELWTSSLPHRTQVVYAPDYSYILHRIRARPGTRIIEAGAGSGSFTHASARAVYNGYPKQPQERKGKVFSFEYHKPRFQKLEEEVKDHLLEGVVQVTHRDVYNDGFLVDEESPNATAVFLDLPAPWDALRHLSRRRIPKADEKEDPNSEWTSPLDPKQSVHICTFSPCIEQVMKTVTELRTLGWIDVDMVEISQKRLNVGRDRVGVAQANDRGFNPHPANVSEALQKLKANMTRSKEFHRTKAAGETGKTEMDVDESTPDDSERPTNGTQTPAVEDKPWMQGRIMHRPEADLKTHTSYLVFAILPREWDEEAEAAAEAKWPCGNEKKTIGNVNKEIRKKEKREMLASKTSKRHKQKAEDEQQDTARSDLAVAPAEQTVETAMEG